MTRGTPSPHTFMLKWKHSLLGMRILRQGPVQLSMETLSATPENSVSHELAEGMPGTNSSRQTQVQTASLHTQHFVSKPHHFC